MKVIMGVFLQITVYVASNDDVIMMSQKERPGKTGKALTRLGRSPSVGGVRGHMSHPAKDFFPASVRSGPLDFMVWACLKTVYL